MTSTTRVGLDFLDTSFTLHCFNILDHSFKVVTNQAPLYPYLLETYIPGIQQLHTRDLSRNALNARFTNNPRIAKSKDGCTMRLTLSSDCQLFLFANLDSVNHLKSMLLTAFAESKDSIELLEYYKGMISD